MEVGVVSTPDEQWGERPKAFVALKESEEATEEEIINFVKERIARFKAPAAVEFVDELPKPPPERSRSSSCASRSGKARNGASVSSALVRRRPPGAPLQGSSEIGRAS